jgi:Na+/melibiose symporter-like transporter
VSDHAAGAQPEQGRLSVPVIFAFALPSFTFSLMHGPTGGMLSGIYAKHWGLSLSFIATAMLVCRLFDAITDPLIGYLSDRTHSRLGRRKPWIIGGTLLSIPAVYFLFVPPDGVGGVYFLVFYLLAFLAWTMTEIPSTAWFTELTRDYTDRARVVAYRSVVGILGGLAFAAAPLLPIFETTEMTPEVLRLVALAVVVMLPIFVAIAVLKVPEGETIATVEPSSMRDLWTSLKVNRPFQIFCLVFVIGGLAGGMNGALFFLYMDTHLLIGDKISYLMLPALLLTLLAMPLWLAIIKKYGKQRAWAAGSAISLAIFPLIALLEPGPGAFAPYLVLVCVSTLASGAVAVAPAAMLADVIDYDIMKSGANRAGSYFAVFTLFAKANAALGGAVAFGLIGLFGYDATAKTHTATEVFGMNLAYVFIPMALFVPTIWLVWNFPIDERRQSIIRRRIESRALRAARDQAGAAAPIPGSPAPAMPRLRDEPEA